MNKIVRDAGNLIADHLNEISNQLGSKTWKLTLVARNTEITDADIVISNDKPELAAKAITDLVKSPKVMVGRTGAA